MIITTLLFVIHLGATQHVGQVRVMNRAEGVLIAVDEGNDGRVDHVYIAIGAKRAVDFSGPGVVEATGNGFMRVMPDVETKRPIMQFYVGEAPPNQRVGGSSTPVKGLVHYEGAVVRVPFAEVDSWPIPSVDGKAPSPPKM